MMQELFHGAGSLHQLPAYLAQRGLADAKVLILHGTNSFGASGAEAALHPLRADHFDDIAPNPKYESVARAADLYRRVQPSVVIAVGGGSVIDTAKGMLASATGTPIDDVLKNEFTVPDPAPLFIAVPTTAGSGSEATHFAVLYRDGVKYSLAHPGLLPQAVWLDPDLLRSCPPSLAFASGADAVCQCVESWWNRNATEQSKQVARKGLELLLPLDVGDRERTLRGAYYAGQAINYTKTTGGHALSYGLTTTLGIPHGLAVLAIMYHLVETVSVPELDSLFAPYGASFPAGFQALAEQIWAEIPLAPYFAHTSEAQVAALHETVNLERLQNHPNPISSAMAEQVYRRVYHTHRRI